MLIASGGLLVSERGIICMLAFLLLVPCVGVAIAFYGRSIARKNSGGMRRFGLVIAIIGVSIPILFCGSFINFNNREPASRKLQKGMSEEEVLAIMGTPDSITGSSWMYYDGPLKLLFMFGVSFDENKRFVSTWIP
jgi:hypothetical protein